MTHREYCLHADFNKSTIRVELGIFAYFEDVEELPSKYLLSAVCEYFLCSNHYNTWSQCVKLIFQQLRKTNSVTFLRSSWTIYRRIYFYVINWTQITQQNVHHFRNDFYLLIIMIILQTSSAAWIIESRQQDPIVWNEDSEAYAIWKLICLLS